MCERIEDKKGKGVILQLKSKIKIKKKIKTREGRKKKYLMLQFGDAGSPCHHKLLEFVLWPAVVPLGKCHSD